MWTSTSRIPTIRTIIDLRHRLQTTATTIRSHVDEAMRAQKISKNEMARLLKTRRSQVDRLLDPASDFTLTTPQRAAAMVGRRVSIELVWLAGLQVSRANPHFGCGPTVTRRDL